MLVPNGIQLTSNYAASSESDARMQSTLVDVEKAFSFGRDYVSSKKHRLTSDLLSRGMTVAFYSKNGLIKEGLLAKWKAGIQASRKVNVKDKGKKKVIVLDEDWSVTNKCSQLAEI
ncbi:hypothetical protein H4Q26_004542 [Puccinia striiformis f. sp. tritici PST-130]|nr:hypothetical protein H4Q26_004542 [Puccinia striiformis f. sp. tritici PST-130]